VITTWWALSCGGVKFGENYFCEDIFSQINFLIIIVKSRKKKQTKQNKARKKYHGVRRSFCANTTASVCSFFNVINRDLTLTF